MKKKSLLALTFFLSQTTSLWAMLPDDQDRRNHFTTHFTSMGRDESQNSAKKVQRLQQSLLEVQRAIELTPLAYLEKEKVFLIGKTGHGKSTLMNFLVGKKIDVDDRGRLDTSHPVEGSEVGHESTKSKTTLPSHCLGPNNSILYDLAGFGDLGGPEKEIINAYAAHRLFSGNFKFLLAVSEYSLSDRMGDLLQTMDILTKTLPVDQLKESLALVVTKQGTNKFFDPHRQLREACSAEENYSLTKSVKELLLHLTDEKNIHVRIPFFPSPNKGGCEYDSPESREKILKSINSLNPLVKPNVHLQLPPEANLLVRELAQNLNEEVKHSVNILRPKIVQLCHNQGNLEDLKENVSAVKASLHELETSDNILKFTFSLNKFFSENETNIITEHVKTLQFLKTLSDHVTYSKEAWSSSLRLTLDQIHHVIDNLAKTIGASITDYAGKTVSNKIIAYSSNVVVATTTEEAKLQNLQESRRVIRVALHNLYNDPQDNMLNFVIPFNMFFDKLEENGLIDSMKHLMNLKTIKMDIAYPKAEWYTALQSPLHHIQGLIGDQEKILQRKQEYKRQEEQRIREEKARAAFEAQLAAQKAATQQAAQQAAQQLAAQQEAAHQAQAEAARRAEEAKRQFMAAIEAQRQQQEAHQKAQEAANARLAEIIRQQQEEAKRSAAQEIERQRLAVQQAVAQQAAQISAFQQQQLQQHQQISALIKQQKIAQENQQQVEQEKRDFDNWRQELLSINEPWAEAFFKFFISQDIPEVSLYYPELGYEAVQYLFKVKFPKLTKLTLAGNAIGNKVTTLLSNRNLPSLITLKLTGNNIEADGVRTLSRNLSTLTCLNLNSNKIGSEGAKWVSNGNFSSLTELELYSNEIGDEGAKWLANGNFSKLKKLNLFANGITNIGAQHLAVGNFPVLMELNLWFNSVGDEGAEYLANGKFSMLTTLGLHANNIGDIGAKALVSDRLPYLRNLTLTSNKLTADGKAALARKYGLTITY